MGGSSQGPGTLGLEARVRDRRRIWLATVQYEGAVNALWEAQLVLKMAQVPC